MQQLGGQVVGRIGDHAERASWQAERSEVGLEHSYRVIGKPLPEQLGPGWMHLDGEHPRAHGDQVPCQRTMSGAEIEHKLPRPYPGVSNDPSRPLVRQGVPAPPGRGHGAPSPRRCPWPDRTGENRAATTDLRTEHEPGDLIAEQRAGVLLEEVPGAGDGHRLRAGNDPAEDRRHASGDRVPVAEGDQERFV